MGQGGGAADGRQGLLELPLVPVHQGLVHPVAGLHVVQGLLGHGAALVEGGVAGLVGTGQLEVGLRFGQFGPGGGDFDIILGHVLAQAAQVALGLGQGGLVILGLEGKEDLAGLDELVVVHRDLAPPGPAPGPKSPPRNRRRRRHRC